MYRQLFVFGSRILGLNHVWQLSGKELWEELASKPGADVKIMDSFFRHREVPDSENFSKPGFQLKTA
ncbi:hypothetical protein ACDP95_01840 [Weissella confusa]